MHARTVLLSVAAIALSLPQSVMAQGRGAFRQLERPQTSSQPDGRADGQTDPRTDSRVPSLEPYLLRPGVYIYPSPDGYRPDHFSPIIRRYPDYSGGRDSFGHLGSGRRDTFRRGGIGNRYSYGYNGYSSGRFYGYGYERAYDQGRYDADHEYLWYLATTRAGRVLNQYAEQFDRGVISFRNGQYGRALVSLLGAAENNHSNAASRLHAGHALFALGRYDEAARIIARAFELSPNLPYKIYDIRDEYGDKSEFDRHRDALRAHVAARPDDAGAVTLLGYVSFFSTGSGSSHAFLEHARDLDPTNMFIPKLLNIARLTSGAPDEARRAPPLRTNLPRANPRYAPVAPAPRRATPPARNRSTGGDPFAPSPDRARVRRVSYAPHHD